MELRSIYKWKNKSNEQNILDHYMAKPAVLGKSEHSDCFFSGRDLVVRTFSSMQPVQAVYFRFGEKPKN